VIDQTVPGPLEVQRMSQDNAGCSLVITRPGEQPVEIALNERETYIVGREEGADLLIAIPEVSREHGELSFRGGWGFEDLGSSNGTLLVEPRGKELSLGGAGWVPVRFGDELLLGSREARLRLVARAPALRATAHGDPTTRSEAARAFAAQLDVAARTRVPVFLLGGSGTGKTHSARELHRASGLEGAFVPLNCARLPTDPNALHSELLGHKKGAYTGADQDRVGRFFSADGGTLFLDEVESLSELGQGFLLDVLEGSGELAPLGASRGERPPTVRVISASKAPLGQSGLRADLCERLAEGHMLALPTLDAREADIPGLLAVFAEEQAALLGADVELTKGALDFARRAKWPGQIRQLRATLIAVAQTKFAQARGDVRIERQDLETHLAARAVAFGTPRESAVFAQGAERVSPARGLTKGDVERALRAHHNNKSAAARSLGVARNTLLKKIKDFGLG
jgi:DNA-binding NtrC family response regulator